MRLATDKQKKRLDELDLPHWEGITFDEATEMIRAETQETEKNNLLNKNKTVKDCHLVENSDWND